MASVGLCSCGGSDEAPARGPLVTIAGSANGFSGKLGMTNNGGDSVLLSQPGHFRFAQGLPPGSGYSVAIWLQPPAQYCRVGNGCGVALAPVHDVTVSCSAGTMRTLHAFGAAPGDGATPGHGLARAADGSWLGVTASGGAYGQGTVFRIDRDGRQSVLYDFHGGPRDGAAPAWPPTLASDGSWYGTAPEGGANGNGVVYKLDANHAESVLYHFSGGSDGNPSSPLLLGADGKLYGTTAGQSGSPGELFRIAPDGRQDLLHTFVYSSADLWTPNGPLVQTGDGAIYGAAGQGGADLAGGVFRYLPSSSSYSVLASLSAIPVGAGSEGGLMQGRDGALYGTTRYGNLQGVGSVYRVSLSGEVRVVHAFDGGADGARPRSTPFQGSDGQLYVTTSESGAYGQGTLVRVDPASGITTPLYDFGAPPDGLGGAWGGLVADANGYLYGVASSGGAYGQGAVYEID